MSKSVALVTGSLGFTGEYVCAELTRAGYQVAGISHGATPGSGSESIDILDRRVLGEFVERVAPEVVIHLAAIAFVAHGDVEQMYRTNVVGTRNLLEALAGLPVKPRAVLLASSANVYGNTDIEPLTEDVVPAPANDYAVSKLAMEYMARLWMDKLPIIIARPFNYTGIGQSEQFLLPKIVGHFRRKQREIELGNINVWRDFQDVRFVANAYRRLVDVDSRAVGETVNFCSGVGHSLSEVIGMLQDIAGYEIAVRVNPAFMRSNEVVRLVGSNMKLKSLIGGIEIIGLRATLDWMYAEPVSR